MRTFIVACDPKCREKLPKGGKVTGVGAWRDVAGFSAP